MLSHGIVNASHVAGLLSSIIGVTNAIDVQVARNKGDLKQDIVIISQLHVINVQQLHDLDRLVARWDTTNICSIFQEECKSILIEMEMMQKMGTLLDINRWLSGFSFTVKLVSKIMSLLECCGSSQHAPINAIASGRFALEASLAFPM